MIVSPDELRIYIQNYLEHAQTLVNLVDTDLRKRAFPDFLLQPYKIIATISTKHGISIDFIEQTKSYDIEVRMVTLPIEQAMFPQKKSEKAAFYIGDSRNGSISHMSVVSKDFADKYKGAESGGTTLIIGPPLDGFVKITTGDITFHDISFGAIINGRPKYREINGYLQIIGRNSASEYNVEKAKQHAKEVFDTALARVLRPDFSIGTKDKTEITRKSLGRRIANFEELLKREKIAERDLQKFFEANPDFLYFGSKYQRAIPQVKMPREGKGELVPDFLLERVTDGFCDILDIKLPDKKIITTAEDRESFSSQVNSAISQVNEYQDFFDEKAHREYILNKYNARVNKPQALVLIGDSTNLDPDELRKIRQRRKDEAEVITYSDIIKQMKFLLSYIS